MGFRMADSPFQRTPQRPRHRCRWLSKNFQTIRLYDSSRAFSMHGERSKMEAETVAFGYPARALVFEQRVELGPLAIRDMRRR